jgi:hypothetical protein
MMKIPFSEWMINHMEVETIDEVFDELDGMNRESLLQGDDVYSMMQTAYHAGAKSNEEE